MTKYGISIADYDALLEQQDGGCAICGNTEPEGRGRYFHVDHCHFCEQSGVGRIVLGLLCASCNLGNRWQTPGWLDAAAAYLAKHHCPDVNPLNCD